MYARELGTRKRKPSQCAYTVGLSDSDDPAYTVQPVAKCQYIQTAGIDRIPAWPTDLASSMFARVTLFQQIAPLEHTVFGGLYLQQKRDKKMRVPQQWHQFLATCTPVLKHIKPWSHPIFQSRKLRHFL